MPGVHLALQRIRPAVSVFGSARIPPGHPYYEAAERISRLLSDAGFAVVSGGAPIAVTLQDGRLPRRLILVAAERPTVKAAERRVDLGMEKSVFNGGVIMGLGYALYEQRWMDDQTGVVLNPNFETYKLPGAADVPRIRVVLLDQPERGVIGVGEPVTIPTAAAVANAVANALGVRIRSLPITPEKVLAAI